MDPATLATELTTALAPALPYLVKGAEGTAGEIGKKLGAGALEKAKRLWERLWPKVEARPAALEAATDVAENPDDEDARAALRFQLKKILQEDQSLVKELTSHIQQAKQEINIISQHVSGGIAAGRDVNVGGDIKTGGGK